ncbi:cytochrome c3 family protein [Bacteroidota bacterium]
MKNVKILSLMLVGLMMTRVSSGQNILGSAHDFSGDTWNTTTEICIVCHTPHNADGSITDAPLWNHQITGQPSFTLYASSTLDATMGQPDASSKLCLSCHDGLTAVDNFGGTTTGTQFITGTADIGTDLSDDHPVSFTYDAALATADGDLNDPTVATSGMGSTINADMLFSGKMQCASCHDVHNGSGEVSMLIKSNSASGLCLTCHTK